MGLYSGSWREYSVLLWQKARQFHNHYERRGPVNPPIWVIGLLLLMSQVMADNSNPESAPADFSDSDGSQTELISENYNEEVFVYGGAVTSRQTGRTTRGFPIEITKLERRVSYADLDLSKEADVIVFESRVETAAKRSCEEHC